ncbi:MAG: hypothetical protein CSA11_08680 [Chloroflexi bacterium]|nr:MAG: hypothetical protein CSA11_08680 [Chloroflexota bacterium]
MVGYVGGGGTAVWLSEQQNVGTDRVGLVDVRWDGGNGRWLAMLVVGERPLVGYVGWVERPFGWLCWWWENGR